MGNGQGRPCGSVRPAGRPTRSIRWLSRVRRVLGRGLHSLGACLSPQDVLDDPVHLRQEVRYTRRLLPALVFLNLRQIEALGHRIRQLEIAAAAASSVLLTLGPSRPEYAIVSCYALCRQLMRPEQNGCRGATNTTTAASSDNVQA